MRVGLLGSLDVEGDDGGSVDVGGAQPRLILAVLAVAAGRVVATDTVIDAVWGEDPPTSAPGTLQSYISRLRRALEPDRARGAESNVLRHEPPGYRLVIDPDAVDFVRFERLADEGRTLLGEGRFDEARTTLLAAEVLWRGPALAEYRDHEFAVGLVARLEARRLAAVDDRIAADLALGRHGSVIGELTELVHEHPLQEDLRAHLALALYRSGRQAEALRAIDETRSTLRDELGVDLGRPLRDLEQQILSHAPELDLVADPSTDSTEPAAATGPRLIGRSSELRQLHDALDEATTTTRVVLIEGAPGIGKTRLAEELAALASARGATVLWGRAFEGGTAPSYWPWLAPLRELAGAQPPAGGGDVLREFVDPSTSAAEHVATSERSRLGFVEAVIDVVESAATTRPLVLFFDDLQWADPASLELLLTLLNRLDRTPLLVVGTVRELEIGRRDEVVEALAVMTRRTGTRRLHLPGLGDDDIAELARQAVGGHVSTTELALIGERAEGNPFYAAELARLLAAGAMAEIPSGVRDVVRQRLGSLPDPSVALLQVAAVIGRDVEIGLLARGADVELDRCLDDIDPAVVHRLLEPVPDRPGTFRFAHALVREVLVDDMSALARARWHVKVADALDDGDEHAEIRAEHLYEAVSIGVGQRAADALERAARVALRRMAYLSAEHLLERAVALRRTGSTREHQEAELAATIMLVSARGARIGYPALVDGPLLSRGKQLATDLDRPVELFHLLWAEWVGVDTSCQIERSHAIATELYLRADSTPTPMAPAIGQTAIGISCWRRGALAEAADHLDRARALVATADEAAFSGLPLDADQVRLSIPFSTFVHDLMGDLEDPEAAYEQVTRAVDGDPYWELVAMAFVAIGALSVGDYERALRAGRRGMKIDPDAVSALWSTSIRGVLGSALAHLGQLDEGRPLADEAFARYRQMGLRTTAFAFLTGPAFGLLDADDPDAAEQYIEIIRGELPHVGEPHWAPTLGVLEARLARARGAPEAEVKATLVAARAQARSIGALAVARRVERAADALDLAFDDAD